jgi:hypothetical protein
VVYKKLLELEERTGKSRGSLLKRAIELLEREESRVCGWDRR